MGVTASILCDVPVSLTYLTGESVAKEITEVSFEMAGPTTRLPLIACDRSKP